MQVSRWMTARPVTVAPQTSVLNARRLLQRHGIRHLPVTAADGTVVGMISDRDLSVGDPQISASLSALQSDLISGRYRSVDTVMASPVHVVRSHESVATAARLLAAWRIGALPVVEDGRLVGIITTVDCLRAIAADDREPRPTPLPGG